MNWLIKFYDDNYNKVSCVLIMMFAIIIIGFASLCYNAPSSASYNYVFTVELLDKKYSAGSVLLECKTKSGFKLTHRVSDYAEATMYTKCNVGDNILINCDARILVLDQTDGTTELIASVADCDRECNFALGYLAVLFICIGILCDWHVSSSYNSKRRKERRATELERCLEDF